MSLHLDATPAHGPADAARQALPPRPPRTTRSRLTWLDIKGSPYLYIAPFFIIFAVFMLYPLIYTLYVSTRNWTLGAQTSTSVGFANFTELYHDHDFWNSVVNTFGIFVISTVPQLLLALFLANLLNRAIRARTLLRIGIVVPIVTSTAVIGLVFNQLYSKDFGLINYLLHFVGVHHIDWKASRWSSWTALATMVDWRWTGYNALIYLAAMQTIPRDIYESASLDGARSSTQFWRITVPLLRPTIIFTVIISTIGGLQLFGEPALFNSGSNYLSGGSLHQFQTVTMYLLQEMFNRSRLGYAGAIAWVLFLLILITSVLNFLIVRRINSEK
ncbi:MAG TPA: sugar ABC transporter permease [Rugosimonospora sp.]|jgi:cellobiose transport system permease protein